MSNDKVKVINGMLEIAQKRLCVTHSEDECTRIAMVVMEIYCTVIVPNEDEKKQVEQFWREQS